jgi:hypothetical protein
MSVNTTASHLQDLNKDNTIVDIQKFISKLIDTYDATTNTWHLFDLPVGFKDKGQKDNWKDFFDTQGLPPLATYSTWIARRTKDMNNGKKASIRLAFFYTWTETWVGKAAEHWMTAPWRAWVAAISSINPGNKQLFIWDCNAQLKALQE